MQYWGDSPCPDQLSQGESVVVVVPLRLLGHSVVGVLCMVCHCAIGSLEESPFPDGLLTLREHVSVDVVMGR